MRRTSWFEPLASRRSVRRAWPLAAGALALLLVVVTLPVGAAAEDASEDQEPASTLDLRVSIDEMEGSVWREVGTVTSRIQGSTAVGDSASSDAIDPAAASEAERSLEDLGAQRTPDGLVITLPESVLFEFDSTELIRDADETLDRVAEVLLYYDEAEVEVHGHTDSRGEDEYNQQLSEERAETVEEELADAGVRESRMTTIGFGASDPVAPNETADGEDDPEGRQQNRRVEILLRER